MAIDMNLISLKDGGRFAMSWLAGTNPKALRSNFQRHNIYSVDVTKVCEEMIKSVKTKEDKISFRILYRLCFGTIHIYAEQVQHLYDVTLNFVCFNTFVLKQYSRKRHSSAVPNPDNSNSKRIRLTSCDDLDISSLLIESEIFNNYTEDKFQFPNQVGHNINRKQNTSTCIQIKQITIKHVSWDEPMPEDEDTFGDASQDERSFLLSGLDDSLRRSCSQKRKMSYTPECSSLKRSRFTNESIDDVRYVPSSQNDTMSEVDLESINQTNQESEKNTIDFNDNDITQIDFESTRVDASSKNQPSNYETSNNQTDFYGFEDSNDTPLPDMLQEYISRTDEDNVVDNISRIDSPISSFSISNENTRNTVFSGKKRKRSEIVIDTFTQIPKPDLDDILKYCFDIDKGEHIASTKKPRIPIVLNKRIISPRFQSDKLLTRFNKNVKLRLQQNHDYNRRLIVEEILDDAYDEFKNLFKIKETYGESRRRQKRENETNVEKLKQSLRSDENNKIIIDDNNNNNSTVINDANNNILVEEELPPNSFQVELNADNHYESQKIGLTLNCSLDEINPFDISFNFPLEAETQRSEWGKEGIMTKLLFAWLSEDNIVNMKSIITGASRINAALAFHTLLDLAGQNYIEIVKDETNSIESIKMGPETIKKINQSCCE
ncbi:myb-like protein D [Episyrphus balteatus]|uniref:myb-like protein D n=1 Tax=Episyrphus balteatus TaxID=286459 RepID=UPI002485A06D|nr:myb-like protein D [Episyrphus balteatus]XP_055847624.1 myb-like protein D [Episyrphus balteatus]XP_055847632.1 myb-like protein D [Episyrphus balteatus]